MKTIKLGDKLAAPAIALGCMRITNLDKPSLNNLIQTAMDNGVNFFDHADIYGAGKSEEVFGQAVRDLAIPRDKLLIQTKCGILNGTFNFSKEHILSSLDASLMRLGMDYVDAFLLHRPDTLMEPEEVAEAFHTLHKAGKVRYFGVSNQNPGHMKLLSKYLGPEQPIIVNQLQLSPAFTSMIDSGLNVNMEVDASINRDGGVLEYCRLEDITIQAWSPFLYGFFDGVFLGSDKYPKLNKVIDRIAQENNITPEAVVIAWILRHPAKIQDLPGTTNAARLKGICAASTIEITRQQWYEIYIAAGNVLP